MPSFLTSKNVQESRFLISRDIEYPCVEAINGNNCNAGWATVLHNLGEVDATVSMQRMAMKSSSAKMKYLADIVYKPE